MGQGLPRITFERHTKGYHKGWGTFLLERGKGGHSNIDWNERKRFCFYYACANQSSFTHDRPLHAICNHPLCSSSKKNSKQESACGRSRCCSLCRWFSFVLSAVRFARGYVWLLYCWFCENLVSATFGFCALIVSSSSLMSLFTSSRLLCAPFWNHRTPFSLSHISCVFCASYLTFSVGNM